jgi:vanillate O-demethylase monooxygenase subunit
MFLRNVWYVAEWARDVGRELRPVEMLGEKIVLYRREDGTPVALEDACPHRKLPLSMGRIKGDDVECGYHGLVFDCSGHCVRVPGQERIPPAARVRSYPAADKWGLIWVWMGEPLLADPDLIFPVTHYDDPAWGRNRGGDMVLDCNYMYMNDNLLDPSHVAWVHQTSFADPACEETPLLVDVTATGVTVSRWMLSSDIAPFYRSLVPFEGKADRLQQYEVRFPSHALIKSIFTPAGTGGSDRSLHPQAFIMDSYNFMTPVDENRTRYFWFQTRNVMPDSEEVSQRMNDGIRSVFEEDRSVLKAVHAGIAASTTPTLDLAIDAGPLRFRRVLNQMIAAESTPRLVAESR